MTDNNNHPSALQPQELEAVFAISRAVAAAEDVELALDSIVKLVRPVFIFDTMVLYAANPEGLLEPTFARAIGRGRTREADLAWGEITAGQVYQTKERYTHVEELSGDDNDRTNIRLSLGLPVNISGQALGALVFIRYGGPPYLSHQIHLAEFVAAHVAQLLERRQLIERIADLEARRRLDSLQDDFIATISHELLTPLGFIKGYATTLLREDTSWDTATQREFLVIIDEESDRLRELIDNLMDSSRLQAGTMRMNFQPIRLDTMLKEISMRARSRNEAMQIILNIDAQGVQIQADPTRLAQVFDNILNNAAKYAPSSPITISLSGTEDQVCITIQDYGPGIAPQNMENLFHRFYRVPDQSTTARGTGLGLYICRKIIQAHQGEITAQSVLGQGTTFYIYLPYERKN